MALRETLSSVKVKVGGWLSIRKVRWGLAILVVLIICLLTYRSMVSGALGQAMMQLENVIRMSEQVDQKLADQKATMEREYNNKLQDMSRKVQRIEEERNILLQRLRAAETRLVALEKRRQDVETHVYQSAEVDSKFTAILQRGRRGR